MLKKSIILVMTIAVLGLSLTTVEAANLKAISYSIAGDSSDIDTLELEPEFRLRGGYPAKINLAFDGDDFYLGTNLGLNLLAADNLNLDLNLMLTSEVDKQDLGKAVGLEAETRNRELSFFWKTYYFIDDDLDDHAYYNGGVNYGLGGRSDLVISFGNQYWDLDNDVLKIGLKYRM